ncbi:ribulose-phosphate 3-epimerase [Candidatus Aenigmatarchaeota archaeon]
MKVAVSMLRSDKDEMTSSWIKERLPDLERAGVDRIHWDLMDGQYNPNRTIDQLTPDLMKEVMSHTKLDADAHMMVNDPLSFFEGIRDCASQFTFHLETCKDSEYLMKTIEKIKSSEKLVGISIEPETPVAELEQYLHLLDAVLIMTVRTRYSGQSFMNMQQKIDRLKEIREKRGLNFNIEVDGGINDKTINQIRNADFVISASYILNNNYRESVKKLKGV